MKRFILLGVLALTACGGGGGGGGTSSTIPQAPPPPSTANTSSVHYMPLASGNTWTFATGAKLVDMGSGALNCTCADNGGNIEQVALYSAGSSTISGSLFFTKNTPAGGTELTNLIGVENDANTNNITLASTTAYPYGVPVMDDSPQANETWSDGAGDTSTVTSVGGTMMLPNGSQVIDIAAAQVTGSFNPITWSFAKGVGITQIGVGAQSTSISSFYVNPLTSMVIGTTRPMHGKTGTVNLHVLSAVFESGGARMPALRQ